ncbi:hypothetical protein CEP53_006715 [Fusarium sp. AF-6]|nr:hypothetical protein CEP53_006715 [Fusarium sp. AF-6]
MPRMNLGLPFQTCNVYPNPCKATVQGAKLYRWSACHVVNYCGVEHQKADRPRHKVQCVPIKQTKTKLEKEEAALRANLGDANILLNAFENAMGNFWAFSGTRPYMRARHDYITALLNVRTGEAVQVALDHSLALLQLSRGDNLGWYAVKATSSYEWGNMELPFLDLKGENTLEPVDEKPLHIDLSFFVALTLIKVRLMKDLMGLQTFVKKKPNATIAARMDYLKEEAASDVLLSREDIVGGDLGEAVAEMRRQAMQLYKKVKEMNPHFWPGVLNPELYAYKVPEAYTMGSPEEAVLVFRQSWYS